MPYFVPHTTIISSHVRETQTYIVISLYIFHIHFGNLHEIQQQQMTQLKCNQNLGVTITAHLHIHSLTACVDCNCADSSGASSETP